MSQDPDESSSKWLQFVNPVICLLGVLACLCFNMTLIPQGLNNSFIVQRSNIHHVPGKKGSKHTHTQIKGMFNQLGTVNAWKMRKKGKKQQKSTTTTTTTTTTIFTPITFWSESLTVIQCGPTFVFFFGGGGGSIFSLNVSPLRQELDAIQEDGSHRNELATLEGNEFGD